MKKTAASFLALTLSALCSIIPLLIRSEFVSGSDHFYHINWAHQVSMGIKEGILYPRWLSLSNGGYGSPTMIFYPPLYYWLTGVVNLFIPSLIVSLKVTTFVGFLLSGLSMYLFLRNFCGHMASAVGGMAYQLLPYHLLRLYVHVTLAEPFAFALFPLIMHFIYTGFTKDGLGNWVGLAFSYAGLVFTHLASAYIFTFVIISYALFLSFKGKSPKLFLRLTLACLFGLAVSAVYFIPMISERKFVHVEWLTEVDFGDYTRNFLFMAKRSNKLHLNLNQIVMLQSLLVISSLMLIYFRRKGREGISSISHYVFFTSLFVFSIFISTSFSISLWKVIPGLPTIQFPWRWLMVSTFAVAALLGLSFDTFSLNSVKEGRVIGISVALFAVIISNLYLSVIYITVSPVPIPNEDMEWILTDGGDVIEYRPAWLSQKTKDFSRLAPSQELLPPPFIRPSQRKEDFSRDNLEPVIFKEGKGAVNVTSWKSHSRHFRVTAATQSTLRISTFYYPGWTALLNGKEISIDIEKDSGAMLLSVPPGKNEVLLEFRDTSLRKVAKWISTISLFAALAGLIVPRFKRPL